MTRTWTDQPEEVESCVRRLSIRLADRSCEVHEASDGGYICTIGGLFGSQSFRCESISQPANPGRSCPCVSNAALNADAVLRWRRERAPRAPVGGVQSAQAHLPRSSQSFRCESILALFALMEAASQKKRTQTLPVGCVFMGGSG